MVANMIEIMVEDNGIGREKSAEINQNKSHKSMATSITNERLLHLNKRFGQHIWLVYTDLKNENNEPAGTRVLLRVPVSGVD